MKQVIMLLIIGPLVGPANGGGVNMSQGLGVYSQETGKGRQRISRGTAGEVEADIFSGRKNPTWLLSETDTRTAFQMLAKLPGAPVTKYYDGLGYRGFHVRKIGTLSKLPHEFKVYKGIAFDGVHYYKDTDRQLERWLLEKGRRNLDKKVYALIKKEMGLAGK